MGEHNSIHHKDRLLLSRTRHRERDFHRLPIPRRPLLLLLLLPVPRPIITTTTTIIITTASRRCQRQQLRPYHQMVMEEKQANSSKDTP